MSLKRLASGLLTELWDLGSPLRKTSGLRILMYHAVGTPLEFDVPGLSIDPGLFRDQMLWLKHQSGLPMVPLDLKALEPGAPRAAVTFDDGYQDNLRAAAPILSKLGIPFTVFVVPSYIMSGKPPYLTAAELKKLTAVPGCQIGSHGMNHRAMAKLSPAEMLEEAQSSKRWIEDALGNPIKIFSYPYGSANLKARQAVAGAGYALACSSRTNTNEPGRDPLMLCRTEILGFDGMRAFRQKLQGAWDWHRFRHRDPLKA